MFCNSRAESARNPQYADNKRWTKSSPVVLKFESPWKSPDWLVKTHIAGPTPRVCDAIAPGRGGARELAFVTGF